MLRFYFANYTGNACVLQTNYTTQICKKEFLKHIIVPLICLVSILPVFFYSRIYIQENKINEVKIHILFVNGSLKDIDRYLSKSLN